MSKTYDVIIVGAGTSGLTARRVVAQKTDNYIVVDDGPLGTTCARVGCMPSKVLIQVANDYQRREKHLQMGIKGSESLELDSKRVMEYVRSLRDRFVRGVTSSTPEWESHLVRKKATFVDSHTLDLEGETVRAKKIILAVGSRPILPKSWEPFKSHLLSTDQFFELEELPKTIAVIGLGVIGSELGQALSRLGVKVIGINIGKAIGGSSDPELQEYIYKQMQKEMIVHTGGANLIEINENNKLIVEAEGKRYEVDKALVSAGRVSNVDKLGLDKLGIELNQRGLPHIHWNTMAIKDAPYIFLPGDSNGDRPILHEAADEGTIAGYNAVHDEQCFKRRTPLAITFSDPNIASVGMNYSLLIEKQVDFVTGKVSFEGQGRSITKNKEVGLLHVYADKQSRKILGAEIYAPDGEHLAHLLAWAISLDLTVFEALRMPFYHPVVEEGLRTALRNCARQLSLPDHGQELFRCDDPPIR